MKIKSRPHLLAPIFLPTLVLYTTWRDTGLCDVTEIVKRKNENAEENAESNLLAAQFTKRGWHITPLLLVQAERYETHFSAFDFSAQFRTSVLL
jgi:hypothetical protein